MERDKSLGERFGLGRFSTREVVVMGLLVAMNIVLTRVASIRIAIGSVEGIRIGFGTLPVVFGSLSMGPLAGGLIGAVGDLIGYWVNPMGPYMPHFTITYTVGGVLPGLIFRSMPGKWRNTWTMGLSIGIPHVIMSCIVVPLLLEHLFSLPVAVTMPPRFIAAAFIIPSYTLICRALIARTGSQGWFIRTLLP
ncbi:putative membrane protein [Thermanaerovibrio velox DSM 12556]|uniref:Putative membrane protein n=1 Tax=Thermanaerovibrio velox DSM 12556 TaxID=926567 RepID=H0UNR1_9BACT|nr:folate family ECF transporter S component [Thermanaerovibrio velox]EHM10476.1 putative membrane protein [Thermanaerovibrio velox DSM 12556]